MSKNNATILTEIKEKILIITLNRPEKRNALNPKIIKELHKTFSKYKTNDQINAAILTGAGSSFCAGADLAYLESLLEKNYEAHLEDSIMLKNLYLSIYNFPKPTLACVNGPALAGGCGLMNVCDFAIAAPSAKFGYPEVKIGFVAAIVSVFLTKTIGDKKTKSMLLTGKIYSAFEAMQMGLIDEVSTGILIKDGINFLNIFKNNSPNAMHLSKLLIHKSTDKELNKKLNLACKFNAKARLTDNFKEGIQSFLQKRKPIWNIRN